jgi:hypothetical protein
MRIPGKDLLLFWRIRLKKNFSKAERGKKIDIRVSLLPKYGCRRRGRQVLVTQMFQSFVVSMRWRQSSSLDPEDCEEPILAETDEENSDINVECLYVSGLFTRDWRGEKWINFTKRYKWCHEECSGTDDWKTLLWFFCNTEQILCPFTLTTMFGKTYLYQSFSKVIFIW